MGGPTPMYVQEALSECKQQKEHMMLGEKSVEGIWKNWMDKFGENIL